MTIIECRQKDETWWRVRRGVPTTSDFGNVITAKSGDFAAAHFKYACKLIADQYDQDYGPQSEWETVSMIEGARKEPDARNLYAFDRGCEVEEVGFVLSDCGRFGSSPDGLPPDGTLELKCPNAKTHVEYLCRGALPDEYKAQVHGQLIVTGREWADFMSYFPGLPPLIVRVEPDDFTDKLRDYLEKFWGIYQSMLAKIQDDRQQLIDEVIDRKGIDVPIELRSFIPSDEVYF